MDPVTLANLLAVLIPLGMKVYIGIQQANTATLKPIEEILAQAETNWDAVIVAAKTELAQ